METQLHVLFVTTDETDVTNTIIPSFLIQVYHMKNVPQPNVRLIASQ